MPRQPLPVRTRPSEGETARRRDGEPARPGDARANAAAGEAAPRDARAGALSRSHALTLSRSPADARNPEDRATEEDARKLWDALRDVMDPELPLSIVDLGLVQAIRAGAGRVEVDLTYTATGCPCMEFIHEDVRARLLREPGVTEVRIRDVWDPPWTSVRISPAGRAALRRHGVVG